VWPYNPPMVSRKFASGLVFAAGLTAWGVSAQADGVRSPGTRALGLGGAMRAVATGDSGPLLNPSGISLIRTYQLEGSYQYVDPLSSHDARISAVDSTSGFNVGGALYYDYHRDSPAAGVTETGHLGGASLSFPFAEKIFVGGSAKYIHYGDPVAGTHSGFTFDAGITLRPLPQFSLGVVGCNLVDKGTVWAPRSLGGGAALLPIPALLFVFDTVIEKVYADPTRDQAIHYMGGGEFSFASSAAIRAGGGRDGLSKNSYVSAGISVLSAEVGALDVGFRRDISGASKSTFLGVSGRLFVPSM
jgi:hypothetical protein